MTGRIAILTGRSDLANTGLSVEQRSFLRAVSPPALTPLEAGYPFHPGAPSEQHVPLPVAALRNARFWLMARLSASFGQEAQAALEILQNSGVRAIVTGSCGLDILRAGWCGQPFAVIALGPVGPPPKGLSIKTIAGRNDLLSRAMAPHPPDHWVSGGHMDYWTCLETQEIVARLLRKGLG